MTSSNDIVLLVARTSESNVFLNSCKPKALSETLRTSGLSRLWKYRYGNIASSTERIGY